MLSIEFQIKKIVPSICFITVIFSNKSHKNRLSGRGWTVFEEIEFNKSSFEHFQASVH